MATLQQEYTVPAPSTAGQRAAHIQPVLLAHAVTAIALIGYAICTVVSVVAPDLLVWYFQPWFHGLTLAPLRPAGAWFQPGEVIVGLLTFGATAWLSTFATAALYNRLAGRA